MSTPHGDRKRRNQKPRVLLSCTICREKKMKCNRQSPCDNCIKRKHGSLCRYVAERQDPHLSPGVSYHPYNHSEPDARRSRSGSGSSIDRSRKAGNEERSGRRSPAAGPGFSDSTNGTRFINSSHWFSIMNNATQQLTEHKRPPILSHSVRNPISPPTEPILLAGLPNPLSLQDALEALPDRQTSDSLISHFLDSGEPAFIIVHVPTFQNEYEEFWKNPSQVSLPWLALLFAILAFGVWIKHTLGIDGTISALEAPDIFYFYRTQSALCLKSSNYTSPGRYKVEALSLYLGVEYVHNNDLKTGISVLLGVVTRVAIVMGYHRDCQKFFQISPFETEMRRRVWLLLQSVDAIISRQTGLPRIMSTRPSQSDALRPRNLLDKDFGPNDSVLPDSSPPHSDIASHIPYLLAAYEALSLSCDITDASSNNTMSDETVACFDQQLQVVRRNIAEAEEQSLSPQIETKQMTTLSHYSLEMTYQCARCTLYRQYLTMQQDTPSHQISQQICVDAARRILELQADLFKTVLIKGPHRRQIWLGSSLSISDCLTAAMVIFLAIVHQSKYGHLPGIQSRAELIGGLKDSYIAWQLSPRQSIEISKAAEIMAIMLRLANVRGIDGADLQNQHPDSSIPVSLSSRERSHLTESGPISQLLHMPLADPAMELFDWNLWDLEMQHLNSVPVAGVDFPQGGPSLT